MTAAINCGDAGMGDGVELNADGDTAYGVVHMLLRLAGLNPSVRTELVIMAARVGKLFTVPVE